METTKPPSRQRRWQLAQKAKGNCTCCAKPAKGKNYCDDCAKRHGTKKRRTANKDAWSRADWSLSNGELAKLFDVTPAAVTYRRKQFGTQRPLGRPARTQP